MRPGNGVSPHMRSVHAGASSTAFDLMCMLPTTERLHASLATRNFRSISIGVWCRFSFGRSDFSRAGIVFRRNYTNLNTRIGQPWKILSIARRD